MFTIAICSESEPQTDMKDHFSTVPIHYKLNLIPNIEKDQSDDVTINKHKFVSFVGESSIIINILHPTSLIKLQNVYQLIISAKLITRNDITYQVKYYAYYRKMSYLGLVCSDTLLPGFYTLKMEFTGDATHDNVEGFLKNSHINKDGVIQ